MAIELIDTLAPKNNGTFPMVKAKDVDVDGNDSPRNSRSSKRLPETSRPPPTRTSTTCSTPAASNERKPSWPTKFINLNNLATFLAKLKTLFVAKELKTGSTNTYKVLSDNNLTDELVAKIKNAGDSTFSGAYADLTGKPAIGGKEDPQR